MTDENRSYRRDRSGSPRRDRNRSYRDKYWKVFE
jgi:hypothetical protein